MSEIKEDSTNPFWDELEIPTKWEIDLRWGYKSYEIDIDPYVRIYSSFIDFLLDSTYHQRVIVDYILRRVSDRNLDFLDLKFNNFDMPKTTFFRVIRELTEHKILLSRGKRSCSYWLNPAMFYKGNRIKDFPNKTKAVNEDPMVRVKARYAQLLEEEKKKKQK